MRKQAQYLRILSRRIKFITTMKNMTMSSRIIFKSIANKSTLSMNFVKMDPESVGGILFHTERQNIEGL